MRTNRTADLFDMVFTGRNQDYGGYILRKRYPRNLLISVIVAVFLFIVTVAGPFLYFYFEPVPLLYDRITDVEYYSVLPPPEDNMSKLTGSLMQQPEEQLTPVVTDSVTEEKLRPVNDKLPAEEEEHPADTVGRGGGG